MGSHSCITRGFIIGIGVDVIAKTKHVLSDLFIYIAYWQEAGNQSLYIVLFTQYKPHLMWVIETVLSTGIRS